MKKKSKKKKSERERERDVLPNHDLFLFILYVDSSARSRAHLLGSILSHDNDYLYRKVSVIPCSIVVQLSLDSEVTIL